MRQAIHNSLWPITEYVLQNISALIISLGPV